MNSLPQRSILLGGLALLAATVFAQTPATPANLPPTPGVNPPPVVNPNAATSATAAANPAASPAVPATPATNAAANANPPPNIAPTTPPATPSSGTAASMPSPSRFSLLDTDGDGRLSVAEFSASRISAAPGNTSGSELVTPPPAKQHWWSRKTTPAVTPADSSMSASQTAFAQLDTNRDGYLSQAELDASINATRK